MRYFSTQRPLGPGCFPKVQGNEVMEIENYDRKMFREEIGRAAWGASYTGTLWPRLMRQYTS